jgi:hypothetical protein
MSGNTAPPPAPLSDPQLSVFVHVAYAEKSLTMLMHKHIIIKTFIKIKAM